MKIAWLHSHFLNWMGGHKYIFEVTKRLAKEHEIIVLTSIASKYAQVQFDSINIPLKTLNCCSTNDPLYWLFLPAMVKKEVENLKRICNTDVVIASYFPANLWAMELKKPYLQICYEPLAFFYDHRFLQEYSLPVRVFLKIMKLLYQNWDKEALLTAKKVITLSEYNRNWIVDCYGRDDIVVNYEGVDINFFKPRRNNHLDKKYKGLKIIFHSTDFTPIKGTDILIRTLPLVLGKVPNLRVLISSTLSNQSEKGKMIKLAKKLDIESYFEFLGFIDYALLPSYYSLADIVVQPSRGQSMSLTVKEAMACETPIITCVEGREQTKDGDAGFLVDINDRQTLANRIIKILSNNKLSKNLGKRGREIINDKFTWDHVSLIIEENLKQLDS